MANKELMVTLGLDASSYSQNIKRAKDLNKELDSSFKLMASSSEKFEDSINGLGKKQDYLSQKIKIANGLTEVYAKRLKESQEALEDAQADMAHYGTQVEKLSKALEIVENDLGKNSDAYEAVAKKLKENVQLYDKAEKALQTHSKRIIEAKVGYNDTQASIQGFNREMTFTAEKLSALRADTNIKNLSNDISDLDHKFSLVKSSVSNFDSTMSGLKQTQDYYNEKSKMSKELLNQYGKEIENSTQKINYYEQELREVNKELEEWDNILKEMKGNEPDYEAVRNEVEALRNEYTQINRIVEFHQNRVDTLGTQYKSTEKEIASLAGSLDATTKKMQSMNEKVTFEPLSKQVKELTNNSIKKLEAEMEKLDNEFKILTTYVENYENSLTGLNQKQKYFSESLELAQKTFQLYSKELSESKTEVQLLTRQQVELERQIESQIATLKKLDGAEWDKQKESVDKLKKKYDEVNKSLDLHQKRLDTVEKEYQTSRMKVVELTTELNKTNKQMDELSRKKVFDNLDNNIKAVTDKMKLLESSFRVTETAVDNFGKSKKDLIQQTTFYNNKINLLRQQLGNFEASMKATETEMTKLKAKQEATSKSAEELRIKLASLDKESVEFSQVILALTKLEAELEDIEAELRKSKTQYDSYQNEVNQTTAEINELTRANNTLNASFRATQISNLANKFTTAGSAISALGNTMMGLTYGVTAVGGAVIKTGMDFTTAMSEVGAVTNASTEQLALLEETAREMGATTTYSATECAQGLKYLGLAGYNAQQAMSSLPKILQLAQAGAIELATASDLATDAISSLGYVGEEAVEILPDFLDKVARASTRSNTSIEQMLQAYIKVGGQLDNMNISLDQSASMLGILANRGMKAEQAGNSLNSILINLTQATGQSAEAMEALGVSAFDKTTGKIRDIEEVILDLNKALKDMGTEQAEIQLTNMLGGKTQAKTLQKLMQGMIDDTGQLSEEYRNLKKEIEDAPNTNALEEMSATMTDNLNGDLKILMSAISETAITLFKEFEPQLRNFVQNLTSHVEKIIDVVKNLTPKQKEMILNFTKFAIVAPIALKAIGGFTSGLGSTLSVVSKVAGGLGKLKTAFNIARGVQTATTAISGATTALGGATSAIAGTASATAGVSGIMGTIGTALGGLSLATVGWGVAIAGAVVGVGVAGKKMYDTMQEDVIPEVDLFADKVTYTAKTVGDATSTMGVEWEKNVVTISEATQKAVGAYMELDTGARNALSSLYINSTPITDEIVSSMTTKFQTMGNMIKTNIQQDANESLTYLSGFFAQSEALAEESEAKILENQSKYYADKQAEITSMEEQIIGIIQGAKDRNEALKNEEVQEILRLQNEMRAKAVYELSEQEIEANVIMERMKANDTRITAEMVSENIKKLNEGRDEAIKTAEEEYEEKIRNITKMRDESKVITAEQADQLIEEATRQKEGIVEKAEETRKEALKKLKELGEDTYEQVDEDTGKILSKWDTLMRKWDNWFPKKKTVEVETKEVTTKVVQSQGSGATMHNLDERMSVGDNLGRAVSALNDYNLEVSSSRMSLDNYQTNGGFYSSNSMKKSSSSSLNDNSLVEALVQQNKLLMELLTNSRPIEVGVNVDGRQIAKASAKYMDSEINIINKRKSRLGGAF